MSSIGPEYFFSCPHCKTALRKSTFRSGNTFGATLWSDGYLDAPMLPSTIKVTRCRSCAKAFFIQDAESLGSYWSCIVPGHDEGDTILPDRCKGAPYIGDAKPDALSELIPQTEDRDRLRYLCIRIWHIHNQAYRDSNAEGQVERPAGFDENLERLITLLDEDRGQDQIMKAEALRELGRHAEALALLQDIDVKFGWMADQIRSMAQAGDRAVGVLRDPDEER
jgi:hypothetical protein